MNATGPLLSVEDLTVRIPLRTGAFRRSRDVVRAVSNVSLKLEPGHALGIVGESGSGKTTLARAILRLIPVTSGRVLFAGRDVLAMPPRELRAWRREAQLVFQDPYGSLDPRMTVEHIIAEPLRAHGIAASSAARDKIADLLQRVGLQPEHMHRLPRQFSGGQRQRIGIARALATAPRLLVCDEPVSALDVSVQSQIINLLGDLRRDSGVALLFIAHNLAVIRQLCDEVAVMYLGRIVEYGPADAIFTNPRHPYTQALLAAAPDPRQRRSERWLTLPGEPPSPLKPPPGCAFNPRCPFAEPLCSNERPQCIPRPADSPGQLTACHFAERVTPAALRDRLRADIA